MTSESLAVLALAALLTVGGGPGSKRLRDLFAGTVETGGTAGVCAHGGVGAARPVYRVAGSVGLGLLVWAVTGAVSAGVVAAGVGFGGPVVLRRFAARPARPDDNVEVATAWAELAVCLEAGLPVAAAVAAAAGPLDGTTGTILRRVAGLLELGGDAAQAWQAAQDDPATAGFARTAARSSATGAALACTARAETTRVREALTNAAEARAQRAGVLIAAPLGLCFLPAFLVLGVVPVVIGLAGEVFVPW